MKMTMAVGMTLGKAGNTAGKETKAETTAAGAGGREGRGGGSKKKAVHVFPVCTDRPPGRDLSLEEELARQEQYQQVVDTVAGGGGNGGNGGGRKGGGAKGRGVMLHALAAAAGFDLIVAPRRAVDAFPDGLEGLTACLGVRVVPYITLDDGSEGSDGGDGGDGGDGSGGGSLEGGSMNGHGGGYVGSGGRDGGGGGGGRVGTCEEVVRAELGRLAML
jgi:hypothetical protein